MSDSMKTLFPAQVTFVAGESPTPAKLVNWAEMTRDAFLTVAQAVGNIWNADRTLQSRGEDIHPLLLTNLVRAIGNLEMLNPRTAYGLTKTRYAQQLAPGQMEHLLDYWPDVPEGASGPDYLEVLYSQGSSGESLDPSIKLEANAAKADPNDLQEKGDWCIQGRMLYTASPSQGEYIIYDGVWKLEDIARSFSVIPHLVQVVAGYGLQVADISSGGEKAYLLTTPIYRMDYDGNPPHYTLEDTQIPLPKLVRYPSNTLIPEGLVQLWDLGNPPAIDKATLVDGAVFYGYGDNYHLVVKNVDLVENNGRYCLVCAAEGLAWAVRTLARHLSDIFEGKNVIFPAHGLLRGLRFTGYDIHGNPLGWPAFPRSRIANHDHTMYLHRLGFDPEDRLCWYNAMVGDLLLASSGSHNNYLNISSNSRKLIFGSPDGPTIYYDVSEKDLLAAGLVVGKHDHSGGKMGAPVKIGVDGQDTKPDYLGNKIVPGTGIAVVRTTTESGTPVLRIDNTGGGGGGGEDTYQLKINAEDLLPGFLAAKLVAGPGIHLSIEDSGGGKVLRISSAESQKVLKTQIFYQNGDFVVPNNVYEVRVILAGGGGGGGVGGFAKWRISSGGGGSGGIVMDSVSVMPGMVIPVTIGQGGKGGVISYTNRQIVYGTNGEPSYFGYFIHAPGGYSPDQHEPILFTNMFCPDRPALSPTLSYTITDSLYARFMLDQIRRASGQSLNTPISRTLRLGGEHNEGLFQGYISEKTAFDVYNLPVGIGAPNFDPMPIVPPEGHPQHGQVVGVYKSSGFVGREVWSAGGAKGTLDVIHLPMRYTTCGGFVFCYEVVQGTIIVWGGSVGGGGGGGSYWGKGGDGGNKSRPGQNGGIAAGGGGGGYSSTADGNVRLLTPGGNGGPGVCVVYWFE